MAPVTVKMQNKMTGRKDHKIVTTTTSTQEVFRDYYIVMPENITQWMGNIDP